MSKSFKAIITVYEFWELDEEVQDKVADSLVDRNLSAKEFITFSEDMHTILINSDRLFFEGGEEFRSEQFQEYVEVNDDGVELDRDPDDEVMLDFTVGDLRFALEEYTVEGQHLSAERIDELIADKDFVNEVWYSVKISHEWEPCIDAAFVMIS